MGRRILIALSVLLLSLSLVDCAGCGRGGEATVEARTTTLGQELQDLKAAYDQGILSEKEYNKKRKELLNE
jgi:uncharacterized membrane protein